MKRTIFSLVFTIVFTVLAFGQTDKIVGKWKTIDDADGSAKSIVNIYKAKDGKYYGKVEKLFKEPNKKCTECEGMNKNKPIAGMVVISSMVEKNGTLTGGTILDPANGKVYRCNISFDTKSNSLKVRGSLDKSGLLGRSQTWVKE